MFWAQVIGLPTLGVIGTLIACRIDKPDPPIEDDDDPQSPATPPG